MYLVIDVGGTFIKYAWMDAAGEIQDSGKIPTMREQGDTIADFIEAIGKIYDGYEDKDVIEGIAIDVPGQVDVATGMVYNGGAINYLDRVNLEKLLGERCDGKRVAVENDAKCAALAEVWRGHASDVDNAVVLIFGTGLGGGIIIDRKVHHGSRMVAGELSWAISDMSRDHLNHLVPESQLDTVEDKFDAWSYLNTTLCGTAALVHRVAKAKGLEDREVSGELIYEWAFAGDEIAIRELEDTYFSIAKLCMNMYVTLDPDIILIGGGISEQPEFLKGIQRYIDKIKTIADMYSGIRLDVCKYRNRSNLLGALYNFKQKYGMID